MSGFEWFLVIVVVILIPLAIAVVVTLWTLEMARRRNPRNRPGGKVSGTKRRAVRNADEPPREDRVEPERDEGSTPAG
jgi:hypothetical protein